MADEFDCPRRSESFVASRFPGPDYWRPERGDAYHMAPTCSYCGSIQPAALFAAIEAGAKIGPTDKNYKVYVEVANPTPDALRVTMGGSANIAEPPSPGAKRQRDMTAKERDLAKACGWGTERSDDWIQFGPAGPIQHGKFYFQHLDEAGRARFIELNNANAINFGDPGYLYVRPFFTRTEVQP